MSRAGKNIVLLDAFDLSEALLVAERIHAIRSVLKSSKEFNDGVLSFERHYIGALAEIAVAKYFCIKHDHNIVSGGDGGVDMVIGGWKTQVKCRTFNGKKPELIFRSLDYFHADVTIATRLESPVAIEIMGCITKAKFKKTAKTKNYGYGDHYYVDESDLSDVGVLIGQTEQAAAA